MEGHKEKIKREDKQATVSLSASPYNPAVCLIN